MPEQECRDCDGKHRADEVARDRVGLHRDGWFVERRALRESVDVGDACLRRCRRCDDGDRLRHVQSAGEHAHAEGSSRPAATRRSASLRRPASCRRRCRRRSAIREPDGTTMRSPAPNRVERHRFDARRSIRAEPIPATARSQLSLRTRRRRACCSRYRAPSSRKTNIVTESKYTSPLPVIVATDACRVSRANGHCDRHVHGEPGRTALAQCTLERRDRVA